MKIVVDARSLGSKPSGIGMYAYDFIKQMLKDKQFNIILLTDVAVSSQIKNLESKGAAVIEMGKAVEKNLGIFSYFRFIQKQLNHIKPDIFWQINFMVPIKLKNIGKLVISVHDMFPITNPELVGRVYSRYFKYCMKKTLKQTDVIMYNSVETKKETERLFPCTARIDSYVSYIIIDVEAQEEVRDDNYFLYIGNLEKRKGVDILIKGYKKYRDNGGDKKLILVGKMQERDIDNLLTQTQLTISGLEYVGYVSHEQKTEFYSLCSAFVFPSRAEGFGIPVAEAISFSKPVIVGDLSIFKELYGKCANYFEFSGVDEETQIDNLAKALEDVKPAEEIDCQKIRHKFSKEVLGQAIISEFIKIAND